MNPCGCRSGTFDTPVKSAPTSGPLTVSSHVIQLPHGMGPPEQFIWVPLRLVKASTTLPFGVTSIVVVPPRAIASYGVPGPNALPGALTSWLRTRYRFSPGPGNDAIPSWRPGRAVPSGRVTGVSVSWNERYWNPLGSQSRTTPSRMSSTGPSGNEGAAIVAAFAALAANPWKGPPRTTAPAVAAVPRRNVRRSI